MSFGHSKSSSSPVFYESWLPGQKEYIPEYMNVWKDIFKGDLESPTAKMLQQITGEAAMRETAQERKRVSGTRGLTAPAKAKALAGVGTTGIEAMSRVPQSIWQQAQQILTQYALTPPQVAAGTEGKTSGFQVGLCWVWTFFNGKDGAATERLRCYRDERFGKTSDISNGYRVMGRFMAPLMTKSQTIRLLVYLTIFKPLTRLVYGERGVWISITSNFWKAIWKVIGRVGLGSSLDPRCTC